ncbi:Rid family detoxifying hydrolase [Saccharopolyspora sp. NPDC050642]|uniref:RidA family protein n=1 Tax=Saccharopolyspora sp. NPDC050642 TaxID=3157099 RepID=UPI0033FAC850
MTKQEIRTDAAPRPAGAYSQGIVAGGFLHTAGFGPKNPKTGEVAETVGEQTAQVLRNVQAVLAEQGLTLDDVVKSTVHLQNLKADFAEFNAAYESFFTAPYPVRTTVGSDLMNILVEIDVVAKLRD